MFSTYEALSLQLQSREERKNQAGAAGGGGRQVAQANPQYGLGLTDGSLTKLLRGHLTGDVGPHQHADVNAHLLSDDVGDELQPFGALIYALEGCREVRGTVNQRG